MIEVVEVNFVNPHIAPHGHRMNVLRRRMVVEFAYVRSVDVDREMTMMILDFHVEMLPEAEVIMVEDLGVPSSMFKVVDENALPSTVFPHSNGNVQGNAFMRREFDDKTILRTRKHFAVNFHMRVVVEAFVNWSCERDHRILNDVNHSLQQLNLYDR